MCDPMTVHTGGRRTTITVDDAATTITISHKRPHSRCPLLVWVFGPIQEQPSGPPPGVYMTTMTATQQVSGTITPTDKLGHPAQVQAGSSVFTSSDPAVLTVAPDPTNELTVVVKGVASGSAQVRWTADADLGDGVVSISAAEDFVITSAQATGASFAFGTPTEQV